MAPSVAFETLGCKLNQYETDAIATALADRGFTVVDSNAPADARVINSCTVTNKADRKSRNTLNRAVRSAGTEGVVVLTGCFVESHREELTGSAATYVVDNARKHTIPEILDAHFRGEVIDPDALDPNVFGFDPPARLFHTRTNIKIQDGCDNFCTFCIIPFVRGRARSRDPESILTEAREAIRGGSRELVLTGVNMSRYVWPGTPAAAAVIEPATSAGPLSTDASATPAATPTAGSVPPVIIPSADAIPLPPTDFVDVVRMILELPGDFRVRISSLEPDGLDERFIALFDHPRMCPHLHLCMQSGSDRILLKMRRMYTTSQYLEIASRLRARTPSFVLTTDLIVGFPGETEADLAASLDMITRANIAHVHTFPYSLRSGTRAERMDGHLDAREIAARSERIRECAESEKRRVRTSFIGATQRVLVERIDRDSNGVVWARGLGEHYIPVRFPAPHDTQPAIATNEFYDVRITTLADGPDPDAYGELVHQAR